MDRIFLGNEQMTVDNKGRVGIPSRFMTVLRTLCPEAGDSVGLMITPDRSIKVMPLTVFNEEIERWNQLNDQINEERMILNISTSLAEVAAMDKQNRIKLNPLMMDICGIERDVMFVGSMRYMQIYDAKVWREMIKKGLPQLGAASAAVARKEEPKPTVQYIINAPAADVPAGNGPGRG